MLPKLDALDTFTGEECDYTVTFHGDKDSPEGSSQYVSVMIGEFSYENMYLLKIYKLFETYKDGTFALICMGQRNDKQTKYVAPLIFDNKTGLVKSAAWTNEEELGPLIDMPMHVSFKEAWSVMEATFIEEGIML